MDALGSLFGRKDKPTRLLYVKGEALQVETPKLLDAPDIEGLDSGLFTPYQAIRQHCEVDVMETEASPLMAACLAVAKVRGQADVLSGVVIQSKDSLDDWLPGVKLDEIFGIPVYIDPETPEGFVFFCSSSRSTMVRDFEQAVACHTNGS